MWPNPQFPADLVTFTEEIFNGKLHFLYSDSLMHNVPKWSGTLLSARPFWGITHWKVKTQNDMNPTNMKK